MAHIHFLGRTQGNLRINDVLVSTGHVMKKQADMSYARQIHIHSLLNSDIYPRKITFLEKISVTVL